MWIYYYKAHISSLQNVHRKFLRFLSHRSGFINQKNNPENYTIRQRHFNVINLEYSIIVKDILMLQKFLKGSLEQEFLLDVIVSNVPSISLRKHNFFYISRRKTVAAQNSPLYRKQKEAFVFSELCDIFFDSSRTVKQKMLKEYFRAPEFYFFIHDYDSFFFCFLFSDNTVFRIKLFRNILCITFWV